MKHLIPLSLIIGSVLLTACFSRFDRPLVSTTQLNYEKDSHGRGVIYYLPLKQLKLTITPSFVKKSTIKTESTDANGAKTTTTEDKNLIQTTFTMEEVIYPDTSAPYLANFRHTGKNSDNVIIKTSDLGLLEQVKVSSDEVTDTVILEAAKAAGIVVGHFYGLPAGGASGASAFYESDIAAPQSLQAVELIINPLDAGTFGDAIAQYGNAPVNIQCLPLIDPIKNASRSTLLELDEKNKGIVYRRLTPYRITVTYDGSDVLNEIIEVPNPHYDTLVNITAYPIVKTDYDLLFSNGSLKSYTSDRPSVVAGVVGLPVQAISAFTSAISELFNFKVTHTSNQKAIVENQKAIAELMKSQNATTEATSN